MPPLPFPVTIAAEPIRAQRGAIPDLTKVTRNDRTQSASARVRRTPLRFRLQYTARRGSCSNRMAQRMVAAMTTTSAQLIIAFDSATLKIEMAGENGAREKIDGVSFSELPFAIREALVAKLDANRARERSKLMTLQGQNIQYVAQAHDTALANKIWGNGRAESRVQRARLRYSSENAGNVDASGNAKRETANTSPRKPAVPKVNLPPLEF